MERKYSTFAWACEDRHNHALCDGQSGECEKFAQKIYRIGSDLMSEKWEKVKLSDVATIKYGKDHKKLDDGKIPVYGTGGVMRYVDTPLYGKKSVLIPRKGSLGNLFFVEKPFWTVDTLFYTEIDENRIIPEYLYYKLKTFDLANMNVGSAVPSLTTAILNPIEFELPPIEVQSEIAKTLGVLDKKIESNKEINHHLLEQAIAIHKYFCVELVDDTFVTETVKSISNEVVTGKTPSTKIKEYYGGSLPFITIPDMHGNVFCVETARYLTNVGEQSQQRKTLPAKSIAVSCIATPGLVCLLDRPSQTNQQINSVIPKENQEYYLFLELLSKSQLIIELGSSGSTTYNLNKTQFEKIEILAPPIEKRGQINQMLSPLFDELNHIQHENNRLIELRDTLLPKLMSGELSVSQAAK